MKENMEAALQKKKPSNQHFMTQKIDYLNYRKDDGVLLKK